MPEFNASRPSVNPDGIALGDVITAASADVAFEDGQTVRLEAKQSKRVTKMAFPGIVSEADLANAVAWLKQQAGQ